MGRTLVAWIDSCAVVFYNRCGGPNLSVHLAPGITTRLEHVDRYTHNHKRVRCDQLEYTNGWSVYGFSNGNIITANNDETQRCDTGTSCDVFRASQYWCMSPSCTKVLHLDEQSVMRLMDYPRERVSKEVWHKETADFLTSGAQFMCWSPDEKWIVVLSEKQLCVINPSTGDADVFPHDGCYGNIAWAPDSTKFAVTTQTATAVQIWNCDGTTFHNTLQFAKPESTTETSHDDRTVIESMAWSPSGRELVLVRANEQVEFWRINGIDVIKYAMAKYKSEYERYDHFGIAWSPDGQTIVVACGTQPCFFPAVY